MTVLAIVTALGAGLAVLLWLYGRSRESGGRADARLDQYEELQNNEDDVRKLHHRVDTDPAYRKRLWDDISRRG